MHTRTTLKNWKSNLIYYLRQDAYFKVCLTTKQKWGKLNTATEIRGTLNAEESLVVDRMLDLIAVYAPPMLNTAIKEDCENLDSVFFINLVVLSQ